MQTLLRNKMVKEMLPKASNQKTNEVKGQSSTLKIQTNKKLTKSETFLKLVKCNLTKSDSNI